MEIITDKMEIITDKMEVIEVKTKDFFTFLAETALLSNFLYVDITVPSDTPFKDLQWRIITNKISPFKISCEEYAHKIKGLDIMKPYALVIFRFEIGRFETFEGAKEAKQTSIELINSIIKNTKPDQFASKYELTDLADFVYLLIANKQVPSDVTDKWLLNAGVKSLEELSDNKLMKCIDYINKRY